MMQTARNKHRERHLPLLGRIFAPMVVFLLSITVTSTFLALAHASPSSKKQASASFGFSIAGDYDQTTNTTNNLQMITQLFNSGQIAFNLGLGDFSYQNNLTKAEAIAWSNYAKSNLPANFPFEIIAGRHDVAQLKTYEADLPPNGIPISATCTPECAYGQQYYFDYPAGSTPLARFIMISPNQKIPGYTYTYTKGGADYNWVKNTIEAAHTAGIPWVIVGMHEYCFAIGYASCKNQDLLDLLLNEHVDVILQAQKHNYQRSKQLALNSKTCKTLNATIYNANCVADASNSLTQGKGSVIVLTGTGGATPQLAVNTSDPKTNYFTTWMPTNNVTWGISEFTISASQLTDHFVPVSGGTYTNSFTITA
jgi:hypothetical protein